MPYVRVAVRVPAVAGALVGSALALSALAPRPWTAVLPVLRSPQALLDSAGTDALLGPLAGALAWLAWSWGALGVLLTAAAALPGLTGRAAEELAGLLLPTGARRAVAVALGLSLATGPAVAVPNLWSGTAPVGLTTAAAVTDLPDPVPGAPAPPPARGPVPDWPAGGPHVVVPGDCLWTIAAGRLSAAAGRVPSDVDVADAVDGWWTANAEVIGPDPDLIRPGQVLAPPP